MEDTVIPPAPSGPRFISKDEVQQSAVIPQACPSCKALVPPSAYFCLSCGKKLRDKPPSTSIITQLGVYSLSIFLPPFGLIPAVKYLRQSDTKSRMIGWVAIVLTIVVSVVTIYYSVVIYKEFTALLNSQFNSQLDINQFR
jgi:ribosomal protein L40E